MACSKCGKRIAPAAPTTQAGVADLLATGNYTFVTYNGKSYTHTIGSPTGAIAKDGMFSYGRGYAGKVILAHNADIAASPALFVPLTGDALKEVMATVPTKTVKAAPKVKEVKTADIVIVNDDDDDDVVNDDDDTVNLQTDLEGLTKDDALSVTEYTARYGYTHHMQVIAKVRSGELLSYKDEDGKTMIYEVEE